MLASPLVLAALLAQFASSIPAPPLRVATFNVQALSAKDSDARFELVARQVADAEFPALLALQEIADNDGTANTGETSAQATLMRLLSALRRAGAPPYQALSLDPPNNAEGGPPGANIRNAVLTTLPFVAKQAPSADVRLEPGRSAPSLTANPGRLGHSKEAYAHTRRPLVVELQWHDSPLILINVHLSSGPTRQDKRAAQAQVLAQFLMPAVQAWPHAPIVLLGDFNLYENEPMVSQFAQMGLRDSVPDGAPTHLAGTRFDRIFVSRSLFASQAAVMPFSAASDHALLWVDLAAAPAWTAPQASGGCNIAPRPADSPLALAGLAWLWLSTHCRCTAMRGKIRAFKRSRCGRANHLGSGPPTESPQPMQAARVVRVLRRRKRSPPGNSDAQL